MAKGKADRGTLSVFKGREAKLNKAIFEILALKGPQPVDTQSADTTTSA